MKSYSKFALPVFVIITVAVVAAVGLSLIRAAGTPNFFETENALLSDSAKDRPDDDASGGSFVEFSGSSPSDDSFSFAAAGDFGERPVSFEVVDAIAESNTDFTLALGDLSYGRTGSEEPWCDEVKQRVGDDYPFQLIAGNHDDGIGTKASILEFRKCLPNKMDNIVGDYAIEYYFDYKDLARFILISPSIGNVGFDYDKGTPHYQWTADAIDDARAEGLPWVVLSMHENCITAGTKTCSIGPDIVNLAVEKKVDLVLQGHEHLYVRSNQWTHGPGCDALEVNIVNQDCIAAKGEDFVAGAGTILAIPGTGGRPLRGIPLNDPEAGYFDSRSGSNLEPSFGFLRFDVNEQRIAAEFIAIRDGELDDKFVITRP